MRTWTEIKEHMAKMSVPEREMFEGGLWLESRKVEAQLHLAQTALAEMWDEYGEHDDGCPEDDTCECEHVSLINAALEGYKP